MSHCCALRLNPVCIYFYVSYITFRSETSVTNMWEKKSMTFLLPDWGLNFNTFPLALILWSYRSLCHSTWTAFWVKFPRNNLESLWGERHVSLFSTRRCAGNSFVEGCCQGTFIMQQAETFHGPTSSKASSLIKTDSCSCCCFLVWQKRPIDHFSLWLSEGDWTCSPGENIWHYIVFVEFS